MSKLILTPRKATNPIALDLESRRTPDQRPLTAARDSELQGGTEGSNLVSSSAALLRTR